MQHYGSVPSESPHVRAPSERLQVAAPGAARVTGLSHWAMTSLALIVFGVFTVQMQDSIRADEWIVPGVAICISGLVLVPAIRKALRRRTHEIFADHLLVLSTVFIVYFVAGSLLVPFGPADQAEYVLAFYRIDAVEAMRVIGVNTIGLGLALFFGSMVGGPSVSRLTLRAVGFGRSIAPEFVIAAFLLVGAASTLYVLPFDIGLQTGVVPGVLRTMSQLLLVAILLAAAHGGRGSTWLLTGAVILTLVEGVSGLLQFNKSVVLLPMVALLAGLGWRFGVKRVIVPGFAVLALSFVLIASPVSTARNTYGVASRVGLGQRIDLLAGALFRPKEAPVERVSTIWARFCYITTQGAALNLYDNGVPGDSFRMLGWSFLPRFLFPMKPIMTSAGTDFQYQVTGQVGSATGQGVFADGYYNLGWWGVIVAGIGVGFILGITSTFARQVYELRAIMWMPFALLGSFMAFRIDGNFLADFWSPFVLILYALFAGAALMESTRISGASRRLV